MSRRQTTPGAITPVDADSSHGALFDDFGATTAAGKVIGSSSRSGHRRHGVDVEGVLSIDHGALRIRPLVRPGWGRCALAYGPFSLHDGLAASIVLTNGRNGSDDLERWPSPVEWSKQWVRGTQSDSPAHRVLRAPFVRGRDPFTRRLRAARADARRPAAERSALNLCFGWSPVPAGGDHLAGPAFVVRSTGPENAELCTIDGGALQSSLALGEVPMRLVLLCAAGRIGYFVALDDGRAPWPLAGLVATTTYPPDRPLWLVLQQRVLGQVGWGMDTRVREIRVDQLADSASIPDVDDADDADEAVVPTATASRCRPIGGTEMIVDDFVGDAAELAGRPVSGGRWQHVAGTRPIVVEHGAARVGAADPEPSGRVARLVRASGQRTAYVVDWAGAPGSIEVEIVPPGSGRGEGHRGRAGLVLYQDTGNHLIVNDWLDDEYPGASVSAFRRVAGFEDVYDAVWTNVGQRITWGRAHTLAVAFDDTGFTAYLDGTAVLGREYRDVYPRHVPLRVNAVGICANWEFGDDTGSRFTRFVARRSTPSHGPR